MRRLGLSKFDLRRRTTMFSCENNTMKREYLFYGLGYLVFAMLFLGPLGYVGYREYDEKKAGAELSQSKKEGSEQKRLAEKAIAGLKNEYPQRSEIMAEEIPKIVRGTTGQAKFVGHPWGCDPAAVPELSEGGCWFVHIHSGGTGGNTSGSNCPDQFGLGAEGWVVTDSGVVTVPADAGAGTYYTEFWKSCDYEWDPIGHPGEFDQGALAYRYEFEVVCMKVTITAVRN